jgi:hypothetical protein
MAAVHRHWVKAGCLNLKVRCHWYAEIAISKPAL